MSKLSSEDVRPQLVADAVRRHLLLILGCAVVLGVAVGVVAQGRSTSYVSTAKVLIRPILGNPFAPDTGASAQQVTIAMQTEAQVAQSAPVAALANKTLHPAWVPGTGTVSAQVPANTQVVSVTYSAPSAQAAKTGAQTVAQAYLDFREAQTTATQKSRMATLTKQADAVRKSLATASKEAGSTNAPPQAAQQVQLYANQLVTIQNSISTLESGGADPGTIISPASLPSKPSGISPWLLGLLGALIGLGIGLLAAIWLERRDKTVRAGTDTQVGPVPVLASDASAAKGLGGGSRGGASAAAGPQVMAQRLRTAVIANCSAPAAVSVAGVTEIVPAGQVAADLAAALREAGHSVVLVETDPRREAEQALGVRSDKGLADVLLGADLSSALVEARGIQVLPAGRALADHEALVFSDRFGNVLSDLRAAWDYVIVSSPAAVAPAGVGMGVATDTTILVGTDGVTSAADVEGVAARAERLGVRILGLAVTRRVKGRRSEAAPAAPAAGPTASGPTAGGAAGGQGTGTSAGPQQRVPAKG